MSKTIVFFRVNKNFEEIAQNEEKHIKEYIISNNIKIDDVVIVEVNSPTEESNMDKILTLKGASDTLLTYSFFSFGRTIESIVSNIQTILDNGFKIIIISQNLELINNDMLTQIVLKIMVVSTELERELIRVRTKESLTAKRNDGMSLGKPKGTIQKSKFDEQRDEIERFLSEGLSVRKIAKILGFNNHIGINNYVKKRKIRDIAKKADKK